MKQLLILSNIAWASIFLFMAYTGPSGENMKTNGSYTYQTDDNEAAIICTKDVFTGLSLNELLQGIARYRRTHWDSINNLKYMKANHIQDSRSCWYSLDTLKKYICVIEKYSQKVGLSSDKLGIRFYYAIYADSISWYPEYKSHHTIFMVPTFLDQTPGKNFNGDATEANTDFDPRYSAKKQQIYTLPDIYASGAGKLNILCLDASTANNQSQFAVKQAIVPGKNQGQLCPPTCVPPIASLSFTNKGLYSFARWDEKPLFRSVNLLGYIDSLYPKGLNWKEAY